MPVTNLATRRPASVGRCYYLCRKCHGTGDAPMSAQPPAKPVQAPAKTVEIKQGVKIIVADRLRCTACGGLGLELR